MPGKRSRESICVRQRTPRCAGAADCRASSYCRRVTRDKLPGRNFKTRKVTLGAGSDPQGDSAFPRLELQIVDDQTGLLGPVHVKARFAAIHLNLVPGPDTGLQIDVGLVLFRSLPARSGEVKIGM